MVDLESGLSSRRVLGHVVVAKALDQESVIVQRRNTVERIASAWDLRVRLGVATQRIVLVSVFLRNFAQ